MWLETLTSSPFYSIQPKGEKMKTQKHSRTLAVLMICVFMLPIASNIAEAAIHKPCSNPKHRDEGGCCAPYFCPCSGDCGSGSAINDIAESLAFEPAKLPGVGTAWEVVKSVYNNWDDITDFLNPFNDNEPEPPPPDPLVNRFNGLENPPFGPGF